VRLHLTLGDSISTSRDGVSFFIVILLTKVNPELPDYSKIINFANLQTTLNLIEMNNDSFSERHLGPGNEDIKKMLETIGVDSLSQLIDQTIPPSIRLQDDLNLPDGMSESEYIEHIRSLAKLNKIYKTYIGLGYYNTITPPVIVRNILENPGWYTSYTPYQAEISQGRLKRC